MKLHDFYPETRPGVDWPEARRLILGNLDVEAEFRDLGVEYTNGHANSKGWRTCWARDREETEPSAGVHAVRAVYHDFGTGESLGLFDAALKWHPGRFGKWADVLKHYAGRAHVDLPRLPTGQGGRIREAEYFYRDDTGSVAYRVVRWRQPNGAKTFTQNPPDGKGGWVTGSGCMEGVEPLPYRLPELVATADDGEPVWIVEGEKDADRLAEHGFCVTTHHGGAANTDRTWPRFVGRLAGRVCYIVPDNDEPGWKHAYRVAELLLPVAESVRIVELPGLPKKGDVSDWLDAGNDPFTLGDLAAQTQPLNPQSITDGRQNRQNRQNSGANGVPDPSIGSFVGSVSRRENFEGSEWPAPKLNPEIESVPFPLDVFPSSLAELCREGSRALQCPEDYLAASALVMAGGVIGQTVNLAIKSTWIEAPNLYLAIVGHPGTRKTPAIKVMARPLYEIDRELRQRYLDEKQDWEHEGKESPPPIPGHLTIDDTTSEAMALIHSENPRGLVVILDELSSWVASLNAYRQGKGADKQFWLKINSGSLVKVTRKGTREPIIVPRPCVSLVGGLTPGMLPAIREGQSDDGWLDRILFAYPEAYPSAGWVDDDIPDALKEDWALSIVRLWSRQQQPTEDGTRRRPWLVHFSGNARGLWIDWYNRHKAEQQHEDYAASLRGPWSKLEGFCGRLALIISQMHQSYDPDMHGRPPVPVDELAVWGASRLVDYFKQHFRRARFDLTRRREIPDHAQAVLRWFRTTDRAEFSRRDAKRNFAGRFARDEEALEETLSWLLKHHCIRRVPAEHKEGRPSSGDFEIHPLLRSESATTPEP